MTALTEEMGLNAIANLLSRYPGRTSIFAGAGISACAGVPLATTDLPGLPSIATQIKEGYHKHGGNPPLSAKDLDAWYATRGLLQDPETLYNDAMLLIGQTPLARQLYLERFFVSAKPGSTHVAIAKLVRHGCVRDVFTTNFDDLIEQAYRLPEGPGFAIAISAGELARSSDPGGTKPRVIKLHGDYFYSHLKNTERETRKLNKHLAELLRPLDGRALVVLGYSGRDIGVMNALERELEARGPPGLGLWWVHRSGTKPVARVQTYVDACGGSFIAADDATPFLTELVRRVNA